MENKDLFSNVGIDAIGFSVPRNAFRLRELAHARNTDPEKYEVGLFAQEMRIADFGEDIITLSFSAACEALSNGNISRDTIDAIFVGTETITYAVKAVSAILKDLLNLKAEVFTQDIYNACAAGTLAILNAIGMVSSGIIKNALVICADISQYEMGSGGEPTQGAGAVALVITRNPRLAVFGSEFGKISSNINDFFRFAGKSTPEVFGKYSVDAYIALQSKVFNDLFVRTKLKFEDIHRFVFHAPFAKLPIKLMRKLFERLILSEAGDSFLKSLLTIKININRKGLGSFEINQQVLEKGCDCIADAEMMKIIEKKFKAICDSNTNHSEALWTILQTNLKEFIQQRILLPLQIPSVVGNMYSASVWAQIYHILVSDSRVGDIIYFGSYGSGATCISGLLKICENAEKYLMKYKKTECILQNKRYIDYDAYDNLRNCVCSETINENSRKAFVWAKITPFAIKNFADENGNFIFLNYCEHHCLLSQIHPVDCCPENHEHKSLFKFPILGEITEISQIEDFDLQRMDKGWVLVEKFENIQVKSIVQLNFLRWDKKTGIRNCYHEQRTIFNWIPVYRSYILDTGSSLAMVKNGQSMHGCANIENEIEEVNPSVC